MTTQRVVIVGGGFGGIEVAKKLRGCRDIEVTIVDRRNHHLFQPLLYQVSMAGLSPADIAMPIRSIFRSYSNVHVVLGEAKRIDAPARHLVTDFGNLPFDWLVVATGANHSYFGHEDWEIHAPGLKNIEQATEIRRRVFRAFELAERESDPAKRRKFLTFCIIGAGPTGVELAGALGEITRFTLTEDFRNIDPASTRIVLVEAGARVLPAFAPVLSQHAQRDLEKLGVQLWLGSAVTNITDDGVQIGAEFLQSATVLWAAGVAASPLGATLGVPVDRAGRVIVEGNLTAPMQDHVFFVGDCAACSGPGGILPGLAPVAMQQGRYVAQSILKRIAGKPVPAFRYIDKGMLATIGRKRAVMQFHGLRMSGFLAWVAWMVIHIWYLVGFRNKILVYLQWVWSFLTYKRGARLIVDKAWQLQK